jgi:hypothetical protein
MSDVAYVVDAIKVGSPVRLEEELTSPTDDLERSLVG